MKKLLIIALVCSGCLNTRTENLSGRDHPLIRLDVAGTTHMSGARAFEDKAPVQTSSDTAPVQTAEEDVAPVQTKTPAGEYY